MRSGRATEIIRRRGGRVARPGIYATLLVLLARRAPIFFIGGAAGAFLPPLVVAYVLAILARRSLVGAHRWRRRWPSLLPPSSDRAPGSPSILSWLQRRYVRAWRRLASIPDRPRWARWSWASVVIGVRWLRRCSRRLAQAVTAHLPRARPSRPLGGVHRARPRSEMNRIIDRGQPRAARRSPASATSAATSGGPILSDQTVGINSVELWVSLEPDADYDGDASTADPQASSAGYPGLEPERADVRDAAGSSEVLDRATRTVARAGLRGSTTPRSQAKADEVRRCIVRRRRRRGTAQVVPLDRGADPRRSRSTSPAAEAFGIKPGDVRRAAATLLVGHRGRQPVRGPEGLRGRRVGRPGAAPQPRPASQDLLIDRPGRRPGRGSPMSPTSASRRRPPSSSAMRVARYVDVAADAQRPRCRVGGGERREPHRGTSTSRSSTAPRSSATAVAREAASSWRLAGDRWRAPDRHLPAPAGRRSAAGGWRRWPSSTLPMALVRRPRLPACVDRRARVSSGRCVGLLAVLGIAARNGARCSCAATGGSRRERGEGPGRELGRIACTASGSRRSVVTAAATALAHACPFVVVGDRPGLEIIRPDGHRRPRRSRLRRRCVTLFVMPVLLPAVRAPSSRAAKADAMRGRGQSAGRRPAGRGPEHVRQSRSGPSSWQQSPSRCAGGLRAGVGRGRSRRAAGRGRPSPSRARDLKRLTLTERRRRAARASRRPAVTRAAVADLVDPVRRAALRRRGRRPGPTRSPSRCVYVREQVDGREHRRRPGDPRRRARRRDARS